METNTLVDVESNNEKYLSVLPLPINQVVPFVKARIKSSQRQKQRCSVHLQEASY